MSCCENFGIDEKGNYTYTAYATDERGSNFSLVRTDVNIKREFVAILSSKEKLDEKESKFKEYFQGRFFNIKDLEPEVLKRVTKEEHNSDVSKLRAEMKELSVGINGQIYLNSPKPTKNGQYIAVDVGEYINLLDKDGNTIKVTEEDKNSGIVYILYDGFNFQKHVTNMLPLGEIDLDDERAVSGRKVKLENYLNKKSQNFSSLSNNIYNKDNIIKGYYIEGDKLKPRNNAKICLVYLGYDNKSSKIIISNLVKEVRWAFNYHLLDSEMNIISTGFISEHLDTYVMSYDTEKCKYLRMTVHSDRTELSEPDISESLNINLGDKVLEFQEFKYSVNRIFDEPIFSDYSLKTKNDPIYDEDIVNLKTLKSEAVLRGDLSLKPIGKNLYNFEKFILDKYLVEGKEVDGYGTKISELIDLSNNKFNRLTVSGLVKEERWSFGYRFLDENLDLLSYGTIHYSLDKLTIKYPSAVVPKYFQMTVFSSKSGELDYTKKIQIEFGDYTYFEKFKGSVSNLDNLPIYSSYSDKSNNNPILDEDIVNLKTLNEININPLKYRDLDKTFTGFDTNYITSSTLGFVRKGNFGKVNCLKTFLGTLKPHTNKDIIRMRVGYVDSIKNSYSEEDITLLTTKELKRVNYSDSPYIMRTINFEEVEIPLGKCIFIHFDVPIRLPLFNNSNTDFDLDEDYRLLYKTDSSDKYSVGYAFSPGIELLNIKSSNKNDEVFGKNLVVLGDSITAHVDSWAYYVSNELGMNLTNLAISGASFKDHPETTMDFRDNMDSNDNNNRTFNQILRLAQKLTKKGEQIKIIHPVTKKFLEVPISLALGTGEIDKVDLVVLACGTNDTFLDKKDAVLDYISIDYPEYDRKINLVTGMMWCVESLLILCPDAKILISTPIQSYISAPRRYVITKHKRDRIIEVSNYYSTPVIDSFVESGISEKFENGNGVNGRYLGDGLHPNSKGKKLMGKFMSKKIINMYNENE